MGILRTKKKGETGDCPPVLVFRGSDSEPSDFAELALNIKGSWSYEIKKSIFGTETKSGTFDRTFSHNDTYAALKQVEMNQQGLMTEPLFTDVAIEKTIPVVAYHLITAKVTVKLQFTATLYMGENGDWPTNFAQGLGFYPKQYSDGVKAAEKIAGIAANNWNNRLIITGHSLGGGLTSAAAIAAQVSEPDLQIYCKTYNAAGITAYTAKQAGGSLNTAALIPVRAYYVFGEILNSLQAPTPLVPIVSNFLRWSGHKMPQAVSNPHGYQGISPGEMSFSHKTYAPMWEALPTLYPLERQTLSQHQYTVLNDIEGLALSSRTLSQFAEKLIDYFVGKLAEGKTLTKGETDAIQEAISARTPEFANMGDAEKEKVKDDILQGNTPPKANLTGDDYIQNIVEPLVDALLADLYYFAQVLVASGEYHLVPTVGFTFFFLQRSKSDTP
nr:hypothetical protein [Marinicella sp. W31]MDC2877306.1 hypothetical protein [Marinicella sp. W31]